MKSFLLLAFALVVNLYAQTQTQSACEKEFSEAEKKYYNGRFNEAINLAARCLAKEALADAEQVRGYKLIAQAYIAQDSLEQAKNAVQNLLEVSPNFNPDPDQEPPPFIKLVDELKQRVSIHNLPTKSAPVRRFRSEPAILWEDDVKNMLAIEDFYDAKWNKHGKGIAHQYELQRIAGSLVVLDNATGLMWQQSGSSKPLDPKSFSIYHYEPSIYFHQLNEEKFAGFSGWRPPTLEEAMSLMEPSRLNGELYIDPVFDQTQKQIVTMDHRLWGVDFSSGRCSVLEGGFYFRAVRSAENPTKEEGRNPYVLSCRLLGNFLLTGLPEPIEGFSAIQRNLKYPAIARIDAIEGTVYVEVIIDKKGEVEKTKIIKSFGHSGCDAAAVAAIRSVKWKPGQARGKPEKVAFLLPVSFRLE